MALMIWSEDLQVNLKEVDDQHKKLVELLNDLHDAMKFGQGKEMLEVTLFELADYTKYHFNTEEGLFILHDYPEYAEHKSKHDMLTEQALDMNKRFSHGHLYLSSETMLFLKDWLNKHILQCDKKFASYLHSRGIH